MLQTRISSTFASSIPSHHPSPLSGSDFTGRRDRVSCPPVLTPGSASPDVTFPRVKTASSRCGTGSTAPSSARR